MKWSIRANGVDVLENEVQQKVQIEAAYHGCKLMRNNSGACKDSTGRLIRFGLGNISKSHSDRIKSSDLVGFTTVIITPDMVGKRVAVFTALEVKASDWEFSSTGRERAQLAFIDWVKAHGGIASFIHNAEHVRDILKGWLR